MRDMVLFSALLFVATSCGPRQTTPSSAEIGPITLVIHGGAGTIRRDQMTPEKEEAYRKTLALALDSGFSVLENGGHAEQAVVASIVVLENSPLFNAGRGAVFNHEGRNEMDAAIMTGADERAGSVAGVMTIKNPITAAVAVMNHSPHVMMSGKGADEFAAENGCEIVNPEYFFDSTRYQQLLRAQQRAGSASAARNLPDKFGTVGAVALDRHGNIAAGTSTGGMTNKRFGRIGDSPIIGAGTYASNRSCAVSATGHGEYFIRTVAAHSIASLHAHASLSLADAADSVVMKTLLPMGGSGGVIALNRKGEFVMTFNSEGMYRGFIRKRGDAKTLIFQDEAD